MKKFNYKDEGAVIQFGILLFWALFWLLNSIDKVINTPVLFWVGKDRVAQFTKYFASIGIEEPFIPFSFLVFVAIVETLTFILIGSALWSFLQGNKARAHFFFFWGTFAGLAIFSFFSIGDQIFGDRAELLEHTIFWIAIIVSWGAYMMFPKLTSSE